MITVRIKGGMGNQMFQYAAGKVLALRHNTSLALDLSSISKAGDVPRVFDMNYFQVQYEQGHPPPPRGFFRKVIDRVGPMALRKVYKEPHFHFDPNFFKIGPDMYIDGYWQSEKYFKHIEPLLREEFTIRDEFIQQVKDRAAIMRSENSVCIHVRRTDFLKKDVADYHGVLEADYYNKAMEYMSARVPNIKVYFFADDMDWLKENLKVDYPYEMVTGVIAHKPIENFYLISQCKHAIISNSTWCWWAAWLNDNPSKIVIAPKRWFANPTLNVKDIIPETWVSIP